MDTTRLPVSGTRGLPRERRGTLTRSQGLEPPDHGGDTRHPPRTPPPPPGRPSRSLPAEAVTREDSSSWALPGAPAPQARGTPSLPRTRPCSSQPPSAAPCTPQPPRRLPSSPPARGPAAGLRASPCTGTREERADRPLPVLLGWVYLMPAGAPAALCLPVSLGRDPSWLRKWLYWTEMGLRRGDEGDVRAWEVALVQRDRCPPEMRTQTHRGLAQEWGLGRGRPCRSRVSGVGPPTPSEARLCGSGPAGALGDDSPGGPTPEADAASALLRRRSEPHVFLSPLGRKSPVQL